MRNQQTNPSFYIMDHDFLQDEVFSEPGIENTQAARASATVLLKNILQGLDASLKALALPAPGGKPLSASNIAALCKESGIRPEVADKVIQEFLAQGDRVTVSKPKNTMNSRVKICPAFNGKNDGDAICIGDACGMNCLSIPL